jgi:hypothetical protein
MERCFDCRFFVPDGRTHSCEIQESDWKKGTCEGDCRRRPPHLGDIVPQKDDDLWRTYCIWPRVLATDWCGEFKPRELEAHAAVSPPHAQESEGAP